MAKVDPRLRVFVAEVTPRFKFLVETFHFNGPDDAEVGYVGYSSPPLWIWVVLEERNRTVDTYVRCDDGEVVRGAPIQRLVAESGTTGLGRIGNSAQTRKGMIKSITAQADAAKRLLPFLLTETGHALMERVGDPG